MVGVRDAKNKKNKKKTKKNKTKPKKTKQTTKQQNKQKRQQQTKKPKKQNKTKQQTNTNKLNQNEKQKQSSARVNLLPIKFIEILRGRQFSQRTLSSQETTCFNLLYCKLITFNDECQVYIIVYLCDRKSLKCP